MTDRVDWSDNENDVIVADYFAMLSKELANEPYVKAVHNRDLQAFLSGRSRGSIEFKHQNISAVLLGLGQPWITGYKPASQFQASLVDAVVRRLDDVTFVKRWETPRAVAERPSLYIGPSPMHRNEPPPVDSERMAMIARKFDVAERDERNRSLGKAGEELVLHYEKSVLESAGRADLAKEVRWTSQIDGDGAGFDILSFSQDEKIKRIEVKTTNGWDRTPFHISRNELNAAEVYRDNWQIVRLYNFVREPRAFELFPPLETYVELTPTSFLAKLR